MDYRPAQLNGVDLPRKMEVRDHDCDEWMMRWVTDKSDGKFMARQWYEGDDIVEASTYHLNHWMQCREIQSFKEFDGVWPEGAEWYVIDKGGHINFGTGEPAKQNSAGTWTATYGSGKFNHVFFEGYDPAKYNDEPVVRQKKRIPRTAEFVRGMRGMRDVNWDNAAEDRIKCTRIYSFKTYSANHSYAGIVYSEMRFIDFEGKEHLPYSEGFE